MRKASISDAKNRFSTYVDLARAGETVLITDRGRPVARIAPLTPSRSGDAEARRLELESRGVIRRAERRPRRDFLKRLPDAPRVRKSALGALLAQRKEGR